MRRRALPLCISGMKQSEKSQTTRLRCVKAKVVCECCSVPGGRREGRGEWGEENNIEVPAWLWPAPSRSPQSRGVLTCGSGLECWRGRTRRQREAVYLRGAKAKSYTLRLGRTPESLFTIYWRFMSGHVTRFWSAHSFPYSCTLTWLTFDTARLAPFWIHLIATAGAK